MKIKVLSKEGATIGEKELPLQFQEPLRLDLIKKAVLAIQNNKRQPYGAYKKAGMRHHVEISKRRRDYKTSYGYGISRVPRKILSSRGTQFFWVGDFAPGTVGGRKAHPPKSGKIFKWKINEKERRKALCSALSATVQKDVVASRGHILPAGYPFIVAEDFEGVAKTKELLAVLDKLGFMPELEKATRMTIRPGKGKRRGRKKLFRKSLLIVVSGICNVKKAANNIPGVDCIHAATLNAEALAPGGHAGRITLFTAKAMDSLSQKWLSKKTISPNPNKLEIRATEKKSPRKTIAKINTKTAKAGAEQ
ncbi:50S ribosomal protein L4 [Candidatus Woesearchaeota archaeon]|nr:50S ribosomal protein L4 [Candidatus Woesearchaeota archaeon]